MPLSTLALTVLAVQAASPAPAGWKRTEPKPGVYLYTPGDLKAGERYNLTLYPAAEFKGGDTKAWLRAVIAGDPIPVGKFSSPETTATEIGTGTMTVASGSFAGGLGGGYFGVTMNGRGRVLRLVMSDQALYKRYEKGTSELITVLATVAAANVAPVPTKTTANGGKADKDGNVVGGPIRPGVYEGEQRYGDDLQRRLRVTLYPNGEYRLEPIDAAGKLTDTETSGAYKYDPATGGLSINSLYDLMHNARDPKDSLCVFGTLKAGTAFIYADEDRGFRRQKTTLMWTKAPTRPAPIAEATAKRAKEEEDARYKFVVAPGRGLKTEAVEAILHNSQFVFQPMGSYSIHTIYILLNDGTVHEGFPAPLDMWDVAASRKGEPKTWGKWKRSGKNYTAAWKGGAYEEILAAPVAPAPVGMRLAGRFGAGSGGSTGSFSTFAFWGVRFDKDGRFQKDSRNGSGTTSTYTDMTGVMISAGGSSNPAPNKGTYRLDGYTLVLKYDDGRIARMPFFRLGDEMIWFEDGILLLDKEG